VSQFDRPKPRVTIRTEWMATHKRRDLSFWGAVGKEVKRRGIRHKDLDSIGAIARELDDEKS